MIPRPASGCWQTECNKLLAVSLTNAISVDVEDYFQTEAMSSVAPRKSWSSFPSRVESSTRALFDLFGKSDVKATFFFLGWVAQRFPSIVREARDLGHEVGCHSYWHHPVFRMTSKEFWEDTYQAKEAIENATGEAVVGYRAPNFSINDCVPWAYPILEELGFEYDSSVYPVRHGLYGNPNARRDPHRVGARLMELPVATWQVFNQNLPVGGGAYLRILPYSLMRSGIRAINNKENLPAVLYLHPWEIDTCQPRLPASLRSRMRQYTGLTGMQSRLERLASQFRLGRIYDSAYLPARLRESLEPARSSAVLELPGATA